MAVAGQGGHKVYRVRMSFTPQSEKPWRVTDVMDQKIRFGARAVGAGVDMSALRGNSHSQLTQR